MHIYTMRYFTHYWSNSTWDASAHQDGELLRHTAGNLFEQRSVAPGDRVYVVTVRKGRLYLLGRLSVKSIVDTNEAKRILCTCDIWEADKHIIAAAATPMRFSFEVPTHTTKKLLFIASGARGVPLRFLQQSEDLDQQTLRGVRELEPESASLLDAFLPADTPNP